MPTPRPSSRIRSASSSRPTAVDGGPGSRLAASGFTLVELLLALILVGILAAIALPRMQPQSVLQLPQQAASLAADLRHLQSLALTGSERLCFEVLASGYRASRYDATAAACESAAMTDPASGQPFERTLAAGIGFDPASLGVLQFDGLGRPVDGAGVPLVADPARQYRLLAGASSASVTVQALTGRIGP